MTPPASNRSPACSVPARLLLAAAACASSCRLACVGATQLQAERRVAGAGRGAAACETSGSGSVRTRAAVSRVAGTCMSTWGTSNCTRLRGERGRRSVQRQQRPVTIGQHGRPRARRSRQDQAGGTQRKIQGQLLVAQQCGTVGRGMLLQPQRLLGRIQQRLADHTSGTVQPSLDLRHSTSMDLAPTQGQHRPSRSACAETAA